MCRTYGRTGSDKMVKQIVRDVLFLGQKSEPATKADIHVGIDLQDTLKANRERCVGPTTRYQNIEVEYFDFSWKKQRMKLSGWSAQICQHEIDHVGQFVGADGTVKQNAVDRLYGTVKPAKRE